MDDQRVIELYEAYDSCRIVGDILGLNMEKVRRILIRNGVKRTGNRPGSDVKVFTSHCRSKHCPALAAMLRSVLGYTVRETADATGIPAGSVANIINRKHPELKAGSPRRLSEAEVDEIESEYVSGASTYAIGKKHGINHSTVSKVMARRGLFRGRGKGPAVERANQARHDEARMRLLHETGVSTSSATGRSAREARRLLRISSRRSDSGISWRAIAERNGSMKCEICGVECNPHDKAWGSHGPTHPSVDHVMRICDGGTDTWDNVRLACCRCNLKENVKRQREVENAKEQAIAHKRA